MFSFYQNDSMESEKNPKHIEIKFTPPPRKQERY